MMASAFSHIAVPIALKIAKAKTVSKRLLVLGMFLSIAPDFDAIAFKFGIPYASQWGHRGFTHSFFFALVISLILMTQAKAFEAMRRSVFWVSFVSISSHAILDAFTNGGLGVAFFWPFDSTRYFFPWRVIEVSPIGVVSFFSARGVTVIASELVYIWLPLMLFAGAVKLLGRKPY